MDYVGNVQQGIAFIEEHLKDHLTVEEVARKVSFSRFHFQRMFQSIVGVSVGEYIRKRRLTNALHELEATRIKIIDLAIVYQFESQESFTKSFKSLHGITPGKYRKTSQGEIGMQLQLPKGWMAAGQGIECYEAGVDRSESHSGKSSAFIRAVGNDAESLATLMQVFKAEQYLGKRVRFSAFVKTKLVDWAALWMRIGDEQNRVIGFDNMNDRSIRGTRDWNIYHVVLDVPGNSATISFGFLLAQATGKAWVDSMRFDVVDDGVATTDTYGVLPSHPVNLDFED